MSDSQSVSADLWSRIRACLSDWQTEATDRQVNASVVAEKLARRAQAFRERVHKPEESGLSSPYLFFSTNHAKYALPLASVVEIQALDAFSPVPGAPDFIHGVIHFRGKILSLLDLGKLFGAAQVGIADVHYFVVADAAGHRLAIMAGDVEDLVNIPHGEIKPSPDWSGHSPAQWISGVYKADRLILDLEAILKDEIFMNSKERR